MKAIISTTYDDKYLFFLPIVTWCWNKLEVDVICFMPYLNGEDQNKRIDVVNDALRSFGSKHQYVGFEAPEHKEATYAQCSRMYAAALDLPDDEVLVTSDIDMVVFQIPPKLENGFSVFGTDLVPIGQMPMCYISATRHDWLRAFNPSQMTYQAVLDQLLGGIECENFRGNYWAKDQEEAYKKIIYYKYMDGWLHQFDRARPGTQFAGNRVDRDDINWRSYCGPHLIDAHLWRPGYTNENFANILELLQTQYPEDNFQWLIDYRNQYIQLL